MAKVELDIAADMELGEFLDMCEEYDLEFKVIENCGPGGGNPVIEFTGDDASIRRFMADNDYDYEDDY
jgi:hypothetical protein